MTNTKTNHEDVSPVNRRYRREASRDEDLKVAMLQKAAQDVISVLNRVMEIDSLSISVDALDRLAHDVGKARHRLTKHKFSAKTDLARLRCRLQDPICGINAYIAELSSVEPAEANTTRYVGLITALKERLDQLLSLFPEVIDIADKLDVETIIRINTLVASAIYVPRIIRAWGDSLPTGKMPLAVDTARLSLGIPLGVLGAQGDKLNKLMLS